MTFQNFMTCCEVTHSFTLVGVAIFLNSHVIYLTGSVSISIRKCILITLSKGNRIMSFANVAIFIKAVANVDLRGFDTLPPIGF